MSFGRTNYRQGGTRGGAAEFKWEDVKNDKYRENYLGHSVNAPVGRWQKNKDLSWYAKASQADRAAVARDELLLAKQRDEDLMNEALGLAPRKRSAPTGQLDASEVKELLRRGQSERDGLMVERVEGLGAAPTAVPGFDTAPKKTLAKRYQDDLASGRGDDTYQLPGSVGNVDQRDLGDKERHKLARKAEKAAKKLKKKEKKERKREKSKKRESERGGDRRDRSRSVSSSRSRSRSLSNSRRRDARSSSRGRHRRHDRRSRLSSRSRSPAQHHERRRSLSRSRARSPPSTRDSHRDNRRRRSFSRSPPRARSRSRSRDRRR